MYEPRPIYFNNIIPEEKLLEVKEQMRKLKQFDIAWSGVMYAVVFN